MPTAVEEERKQQTSRPPSPGLGRVLRTLQPNQQEMDWQRQLDRVMTGVRAARDHQTLRRTGGGRAAIPPTDERVDQQDDRSGPSPAIAPRGPLAAAGTSEDAPPQEQSDKLTPEPEQEQTEKGTPQPETSAAGERPAGPERRPDTSGPLTGVNEDYDPFAAARSPQARGGGGKAAAAAVAGALIGAGVGGPAGATAGARAGGAVGAEAGAAAGARMGATAGAESGAETGAAAGGQRTLQQRLRSGKINLQRSQQQILRAASRHADREMQKAIHEELAHSVWWANMMVNNFYKKGWQWLQEAVEDWALSFTDFFLLSGPVNIALYMSRWVFGNMMGSLFTKSIKAPLPQAIQGDQQLYVKVKIFPPYSLFDTLDYVRHIKFILIAALTLMIYGLIIMVLYYASHWGAAVILVLKAGLWPIIRGLPAFIGFGGGASGGGGGGSTW